MASYLPLPIAYFPCSRPEAEMVSSLSGGVTQTFIQKSESSIILPFYDCFGFPLTFAIGHGTSKRHPRKSSCHIVVLAFSVAATQLPFGNWDQSLQPVE